MTDPRAVVEIRVPAVELKKGDLVNTQPGEDDWQEVLGVYRTATDARSTEIQSLVNSLGGRYVVVQLTDLLPVDGGVYFADDGTPMVYGDEEDGDRAVAESVSESNGVRTYLFTRFELVSVRATS
ncbi:hypothetical protein SAMN05443575_2113 [Jatrophihabitans endophyticus]|uniref:Uncharacterized protein n=1 Tax=Jatrophihabitans endophyticus TaxID=1206085 RepID=A0A1M5KCM1_9ACTN|nr:hypothetical protein [Jatrophihabitans endophyticus]SHG50431.1 hypothetical protein SAMN05443575_2113 [Jatrophihabitans endophyticus]